MGLPKTCKEARITKGNHPNNFFHTITLKCAKETLAGEVAGRGSGMEGAAHRGSKEATCAGRTSLKGPECREPWSHSG